MFAAISENPYHPQGKLANETTRKMIATQYSLGRPEWDNKWQSTTTNSFQKVLEIQKLTFLYIASGPTQVCQCSKIRSLTDLFRYGQGRTAFKHQGQFQACT